METEDKKTRFKRLAEARTNKILDTLDLLGNLSNTSFYDYTDEEVANIFDTIIDAVEQNRQKFGKKSKKKRFIL